MKKILLGLFGLISLGLINFSNAGSYIYSGTANFSVSANSSTSSMTTLNFPIPISISNFSSDLGTINISCDFDNFNNHGLDFILSPTTNYGGVFRYTYFTSIGNTNSYLNNGINKVFGSGNFSDTFNISDTKFISSLFLNFYVKNPHDATTLTFDYSCTVSGDNIFNQNSSSSSCSPSGSCTVNDKLSDNILYSGSVSLNSSSYSNIFNYGDNGAGTYCIKLTSSSAQTLTFGFANGGTTTPSNLYQLYNDQYGNRVCLYGNKAYFNAKLNSSSNTVNYEVYKLTDLLSDDIPCAGSSSSCDYSDYILLSDVTENYCTNRYSNLIDEEDITSGYCETEFGLIDPENCPASGGTGDINWSTFWVNNYQVQGASSIYLYIPEFLSWDYTYLDSGATLQIDVENEGDQDYIQNILDIQSYHPDNDQFAVSFTGFLTLLMPYIIVTLFIVFVWRLIRRIFK